MYMHDVHVHSCWLQHADSHVDLAGQPHPGDEPWVHAHHVVARVAIVLPGAATSPAQCTPHTPGMGGGGRGEGGRGEDIELYPHTQCKGIS